MPRKLRIEYEGALYHVLNRGNYRRDVFETAGAAQAFLSALEEGSGIYGWRVHAFVVMRNHYHLAVETPKANLVDGMHWLQSTIAARFNRFRDVRGHLFQGRSQAILLEDFPTLARVVNYIHLNPVRAGVVEAEKAMDFPWSSLARFMKGPRFQALRAVDWLEAHGLSDTKAGWRDYVEQLVELAGDKESQKLQGFATLSKGWAIGTPGWRKALAQDHAHRAISPGIEAAQKRDLKEARWQDSLQALMTAAKRTNAEAISTPKGSTWKIQLAKKLRQSEGASIAWIAENLHMGRPGAVRTYLSQNYRKPTN